MDALASLSPATRAWFERAFDGPTPAQELAWPAIATGAHVLVQAPTGSGKTLAAFLQGIDRLNDRPGRGAAAPLRLAAEGAELRHRAESPRAAGRSSGRSSSSACARATPPQRDRQRMLRRLPTSSSRRPSRSTCSSPRGGGRCCAASRRDRRRDPRGGGDEARRAPRALPRAARAGGGRAVQRIGLSATQRPLDGDRALLGGSAPAREVTLVDAGSAQGARPRGRGPGRGHARAGRGRPRAAGRQDGVEMDPATRPRALDLAGDYPRSSSWSARTARRSSSSTTAGWPSGSPCASTSWPRRSRPRPPRLARQGAAAC